MAADVPASNTDGGSAFAKLARGLVPAVLTLAAALYSALVVCNAGESEATSAQWNRLAAEVQGARTATELIVFAPDWIDPIGRQYLGDQMDVEMASRMDSARYSGIWEVGLDGARARETRGLIADRTLEAGPLSLRHYVQAPAKVVFDFTSKWREGKSSGPMQGRPNLSLQEVDFAPHRCIKVVPRPDQTAIMTFEGIPLGSKIVGYVGLADIFTRRDIRDPGRLSLLVDGELRETVRAGIDDGWQRFEIATSPGWGTVEFRLTAVGAKALDRRICFAAEARE
ncbi:MAG: hypothetical protein GY811_13220 [Myxococcales bacterium]|nr:hypothetical protein [Myxococcales bacterium]